MRTTAKDLPPHLRKSVPPPPPPELQLPFEPLEVPPLPAKDGAKKDAPPADPFLRRN